MAQFVQLNVAKVLLACCCMTLLSISANLPTTSAASEPIWELLRPSEKTNRLYNVLGHLVSAHCRATSALTNVPVKKCKYELLNYGNGKLQAMPEEQLDILNPSQRGADKLIWSAIMGDYPSTSATIIRNLLPTSTENPMFNSDTNKDVYAMDMDIAYGHPSMAHNPQIDVFDVSAQKTYLTGPSVVRVKLDGSPVEEDQQKPPVRDEDLEFYPGVTLNRPEDIKTDSGNNQQKHRKIATISALKQQYLANLAKQQQELLPPF